jgi:hypothetical protein
MTRARFTISASKPGARPKAAPESTAASSDCGVRIVPAPTRSSGPLPGHGRDHLGGRFGPEGDLGDGQPAFQQGIGQRQRIGGALDGDDGNDAQRGGPLECGGHVRFSLFGCP